MDTGVAAGSLAVGDVVRKPLTAAPSGFLRCNGAEVAKSAYPALYAVVGDKYANGGVIPGSGQPWSQQYGLSSEETLTGEITSEWSENLLYNVGEDGFYQHSQALVAKNRVYYWRSFIMDDGSEYIQTTSAGTLSNGGTTTWTSSATRPGTSVSGATVFVTKKNVYMIGAGSGLSNKGIYAAPVLPDGRVGDMALYANLPVPIFPAKVVVTSSRVYVWGMSRPNFPLTSAPVIYSCSLTAEGLLSSWTNHTNLNMNKGVADGLTAVIKNKVYSIDTVSSQFHSAVIAPDGSLGAWSPITWPSPSSDEGLHVVVTKSRIYLLTNRPGTYFTCAINPDGSLGLWSYTASSESYLRETNVFVTKGRLSLMGYSSNRTRLVHHSARLSAGTNDYSDYYSVPFVVNDPALFRLPDFSAQESSGLSYFMKY